MQVTMMMDLHCIATIDTLVINKYPKMSSSLDLRIRVYDKKSSAVIYMLQYINIYDKLLVWLLSTHRWPACCGVSNMFRPLHTQQPD